MRRAGMIGHDALRSPPLVSECIESRRCRQEFSIQNSALCNKHLGVIGYDSPKQPLCGARHSSATAAGAVVLRENPYPCARADSPENHDALRDPMGALLSALLSFVRAALRSRAALALENAVLRQQLTVYQRVQKRVRLRTEDCVFWVVLRRLWPTWSRALIVVKPETVIAWHRQGFWVVLAPSVHAGKGRSSPDSPGARCLRPTHLDRPSRVGRGQDRRGARGQVRHPAFGPHVPALHVLAPRRTSWRSSLAHLRS
jgi:hypothetical protein